MKRSLVLAAVTVTMAMPRATAAPSEPAQPNPLDEARNAAASTPFSGRVEVEWRDATGLHRTEVDVEGRDGVFFANGQRQVMGVGEERLVHGSEDGWHELWPSGLDGEAGHSLPPPYKVRPTDVHGNQQPDEGLVATHKTVRLDIAKDKLRERLDLDRDTKFLLAREQYGADGKTVEQGFRFQTIKLPDPDMKLPPTPMRSAKDGPNRMERPSEREPRRLTAGYQLVGQYHPRGMLQLVYGDGFYDVSLFREQGRVDDVDLPGHGRIWTAGGHRFWKFSWPGGQGVVWAAGRTVYTLVGDAPSDELGKVAASVPVHRSTSVAHRLRQACRSLVESFRGRF